MIPPRQGGPDVTRLLKQYQPNAVCFQGPEDRPHNLRWVGNEDGLAPENCWATTNAGEARFDGTVPDEPAGVGDPDGKYYRPAETDMPNRTHAAFGGGWAWRENEAHLIYSPEALLDCYIRCVGHKRIVPFSELAASQVTVEITASAGAPALRDIEIY